ncbi:hypothetical protein [Streptomyces bluensis]|uniref:hypothetical protein n=1 Tax=Streptomyces bluensis TaxID=33897 RepID=UPI001676B349|nr:hypothetical protein [Streptomyces bluensis]GGZ48553.1 hypothetical protein GCM10010344_12400 [Streptomyces bluensis]
MEAELTSLAVAGATALVTQMVTDGWEQARDRVVAFFTRGRDGEGEVVQAELEESRADLVAARDAGDEETAADVRDEWRLRLRRILRADPSAAVELQALLDELRPPQDQPKGTVHNTISGGVQHGTVIQAHTIGDLTIGEPRP